MRKGGDFQKKKISNNFSKYFQTIPPAKNRGRLQIRINQLPVFAAKWQHGTQTCFATFIRQKNHEVANNKTNSEAREKKHGFVILIIFEKFSCFFD
jgi:hypothetical protein